LPVPVLRISSIGLSQGVVGTGESYGFDGLIGYVRGLVLRSDQAGAALLRIVMPLTLNAPASGPLSAYKTEEDIRAEFAAKGIPYEVIHRLEFHRPEDVEDGEDGYGHDGLIHIRGSIRRRMRHVHPMYRPRPHSARGREISIPPKTVWITTARSRSRGPTGALTARVGMQGSTNPSVRMWRGSMVVEIASARRQVESSQCRGTGLIGPEFSLLMSCVPVGVIFGVEGIINERTAEHQPALAKARRRCSPTCNRIPGRGIQTGHTKYL
jgi:hypothetical protein